MIQRNSLVLPGRSRRPWRTLFERALGSLQYSAVLSLTEASGNSIERGEGGTSRGEGLNAAPAGKVVWANEGFEKLAGVDAADLVGQEICSLFEEGEGEEGEGEEGEERGELKQSLELGQVSPVWSTYIGEAEKHVTRRRHTSGSPSLINTAVLSQDEPLMLPYTSCIAIRTWTPKRKKKPQTAREERDTLRHMLLRVDRDLWVKIRDKPQYSAPTSPLQRNFRKSLKRMYISSTACCG